MSVLSHALATGLLVQLRRDVHEPRGVDLEGWAERLSDLDGRAWLLLDKLARRSTREQPAIMSGTKGWDALELTEAPVPAVLAASMHVDGQRREAATRALGRHAGLTASAAVALRLLDHVPEVAQAALVSASERETELEIDLVAEVLLNGADRRVTADRWSGFVDVLRLDSPQTLNVLRSSRYQSARRWAVEQALAAELLGPTEVVEIASGDQDQWLRRAAAEHLASTSAPDRLAQLLAARSVEARLIAVTHGPEELLDASTLEGLLLDRAPRVREQARWRARRRDLDIADVCRRHLGDRAPGAVAAALDGLTWVGTEPDLPAIADLLQHRSPRVRAAAVRTFAARAPGPQVISMLSPRLEDPSGRVSSAAAVVLVRADAPAAVASRAWESPSPSARRAAWRVSRGPGGWQRLAADLRAAADLESNLAGLGRSGVRGWLQDGAATTWGRPDPADEESIAHNLIKSGLYEDESELVAFHAGLPAVRRSFPPASNPAQTTPNRSQPPVLRRIRRWFGHGTT